MTELLARLVDSGVRFVVVGSSGAALLGADLSPGDLDICPDTDVANLGRLAAYLAGLGARPRVGIPGWVTPEEAAERLSLGRSRIFELISTGRLRSVRIGGSRRIPAAALTDFVNDLTGSDAGRFG